MTIGVIAKIKIKPNAAEAFEQTFTQLGQAVNDKEVGNTFYQLYRSVDESNTYTVLEQYTDKAALTLHENSEHFQYFVGQLAEFMLGAPELELLEGVS